MGTYSLSEIAGHAITCRDSTGKFCPYRIIAVKSHAFVRDTLSETPEEAIQKAEKLAAENPGEKFYVYGPIMEVGSDIPIKKTSLLKSLIEKIGG